MAKQIDGYLKLQVRGGQANPAPPVGPALGSKGINIMEFCNQFNARTDDRKGQVLPVVITIYKDKSFDFVIKTQMKDLNAFKVSSAMKMIAGTARSMGVKVKGVFPENVN